MMFVFSSLFFFFFPLPWQRIKYKKGGYQPSNIIIKNLRTEQQNETGSFLTSLLKEEAEESARWGVICVRVRLCLSTFLHG